MSMEPSGLHEYTSDQEHMERVKDILEHPVLQPMDQCIQHGTTTCRTHYAQVSYLEYKFYKRFGGDWKSAVRTGLLHDLLLYDWHTHARGTGKYFHGLTHPREALHNTDRYFSLSWEEKMIVLRRMWSLTPIPPVTKTGYTITYAGKLCSMLEITARFGRRLMICSPAQLARRQRKGKEKSDTNAWTQMLGNQILVSAVMGWMVAQFFKTLIDFLLNRSFNAERLVGSGGMSNSHSATACGMTTVTMLRYGVGSFEFAVSFVVSMVVVYDAIEVRREAGKQAKFLNSTPMEDPLRLNVGVLQEKLKEYVGHTPLRVMAGAILGVLLALVVDPYL